MSKERASDTEVEAEIVKDEDGTANHGTGNVSVSELQAMYIPYNTVSEEGIASYLISLEAHEGNAVILQMKPESGQLVWESSAELSTSYGTSGTTSMRSIVNSLHEDNIYVVADISCFLDNSLASRNTSLALTTQDNKPYSDSYGSWLDPYNTDVQAYLSDLVRELCNIGFDEIMLSNYCLPIEGTMGDRTANTPNNTSTPNNMDPDNLDTGDDTNDPNAGNNSTVDPTVYYVGKQNSGSISTTLSDFAEQLSEITSTYRAALSIRCDSTVLRNHLGDQTGQDLSTLEKQFRRLYCNTDDEHLESDTAIFEDLLGDDCEFRFVPIMKTPAKKGNWTVR